MASGNLKLKLLVDKVRRKVLFAEAGKDVVDFLFSILALPVGEVIRLLGKHSMVGCLGKLYESVENLDYSYVQSYQFKSHLLAPKAASPVFSGKSSAALTWKKEENPIPHKYYRCANSRHPNCYNSSSCKMYGCGDFPDDSGDSSSCKRHGCGYFSDDSGAICPGCFHVMTTEMKYVPPPAGMKVGTVIGFGEVGFVKGVVTYMVMDDLSVVPMSTISSITMLNKCGVKEVGSLEEMTVDLDMNKALEMLKASLQSITVLTDVFLPKELK